MKVMRMNLRPEDKRRQGYRQQGRKPVWLCICRNCGRKSERFEAPKCCNRMSDKGGVRHICRGSMKALKVVRFTDVDGRPAEPQES